MNTIEQKWANYFDTLGYDYLYKPEEFYLDGGHLYTPHFYLIDFQTIAHVTTGHLPTRLLHCLTHCCCQYGFKGVLLNKPKPTYGWFEMIVPTHLEKRSHLSNNEKMTITPEIDYDGIDINMVEDPNNKGQFLTHQFLTDKEEYAARGLHKVIQAVENC